MPNSCDASEPLRALQAAAVDTRDPEELGALVVRALKAALPQAGWIGIYWVRGAALELGPYVGPDTEHQRIARGQGVCGTAWAAGEDQLVADVRELSNYLPCSPTVRSELVVLIESHGRVVGEIDLDADAVGAFDPDDQCVVRAVADSFGALIEPSTLAANQLAKEPRDA